MKWSQRILVGCFCLVLVGWLGFFVTVNDTCFISFSTLRILSCALQTRGKEREENQRLCLRYPFQRAASCISLL